jgi:hypothetical protein
VNSAIDAGVKSLYLYHHDPTYDDKEVAMIHRSAVGIAQDRRSRMECHVAHEGLTIAI